VVGSLSKILVLYPVYTIQPADKLVVKPGCTTGLTTGYIDDTAGCQTGCQTGFTTGLTTGCIV